ncbi:arabinose import ATP-binding protein AraG [Labrys miyagiensis]|uniref:Arabinose import ATP-binding protein AraG n=1 Tax=Labrys miyagiensis TaxID=346912 RepID=A0ABQ6CMM5_9HYPH|nr:L-arabinose ABC transporter ATP-binding protein AraG [Labrys miyagiensis]GLS21075.1 arabinose import ATP-binding protein AraG [Labrys miyagiensis]
MTQSLAFTDISKSFPGVKALQNISFSVPGGSVHGLLGENGAGKSTLIKILGGDITPDTGAIVLEGQQQNYTSVMGAMTAGIAVVHQELQLVPELSVGENLTLGRFPNKGGVVSFRDLHARARKALAEVGGGIDSRAKIASLSIGQRQMVEIAKAIMFEAKVIALDEPTSSLSSTESEVLFALVDKLRAQGKIILYVSHRLDEIFRLCNGCTILRDGKFAFHAESMEGLTRDDIVRAMVGREIADIWGWRGRDQGQTRLSVDGVTGRRLSRPASFDIKAGEILGLFGLIGAGRSELFRLVYGADPIWNGSVGVDGKKVSARNPKRSITIGAMFCPEDRKADGIVQGQSVAENIVISTRRNFSPFGLLSRTKEKAVAEDYVQKLRVRTPSIRQNIVNLSGGNQQKTILARWLAENELKVLLVDEPTRGIDVGAKAEIYAILYDLAARGVAIGVISSDLPEVMGVCDRILVMRQGSIVEEFRRGDFNEHRILEAALPASSVQQDTVSQETAS